MRRPGGWMQLPTDDRILEALDTGLMLTPAVIAVNIGSSRENVARRLSDLVDKGFVAHPRRGYYEITTRGRAYLEGDLDASGLDGDE